MSLAISRTLRFKDAGVRLAYYTHFWTSPRRLATIGYCLGFNGCSYIALLGLAQLPESSAIWLRMGLEASSSTSASSAIFSLASCAYFMLLARNEARLAHRVQPYPHGLQHYPHGQRPPSCLLLNPSGLGIGQQNLLLACLFWPVVVLRVVALILRPADLYARDAYQQAGYLSGTTLAYAPICARLPPPGGPPPPPPPPRHFAAPSSRQHFFPPASRFAHNCQRLAFVIANASPGSRHHLPAYSPVTSSESESL